MLIKEKLNNGRDKLNNGRDKLIEAPNILEIIIKLIRLVNMTFKHPEYKILLEVRM